MINNNTAIIEVKLGKDDNEQFIIDSRPDMCWRTWAESLQTFFTHYSDVSTRLAALEVQTFLKHFKNDIQADFLAFALGQVMTIQAATDVAVYFESTTDELNIDKISFVAHAENREKCRHFKVGNGKYQKVQKNTKNAPRLSTCSVIRIDSCQDMDGQCMNKLV